MKMFNRKLIWIIAPFIVNSNSPKNCCFVKVETDEGISGWGECYVYPEGEIHMSLYPCFIVD